MASSSEPIVLQCSDGVIFQMEEAVAEQSVIIKAMIACNYYKKRLPIPDVTSDILSKVYDYCRKHYKTADDDEAVIEYDKEFFNVDLETLKKYSNAAKFLDIKSLSSSLWDALMEKASKRKPIWKLHHGVPVRPARIRFAFDED